MILLAKFTVFLTLVAVKAQFDIPDPQVIFYRPRGFSISIPGDPDIRLVGFHAARNRVLIGTEAGEWNVDITRETKGRYVFEETGARFEDNDILSYWINVVLTNGQGVTRLDLSARASEFVMRSSTSFPASSPIGFEVPTPEVKHFPRGFEVSIPAEEGMTLMAFHGQLNEPFTGLQAGHWAADVTRPTDGRFRFVERSTKLKPGDVLHFWLHVVFNGLGYNLEGQEYRVPGGGTSPAPPPDRPTRPVVPPVTQPTVPTTVPISGVSSCQRSPTVLKDGSHPCAGALIFEDDFSGGKLSDHWEVEKRFGSIEPDNEFVIYLNRSDNLRVTGGQLRIRPTFTEGVYQDRYTLDIPGCTGEIDSPSCSRSREKFFDILPPILSARINTKSQFEFLYGKVEIRAQLPGGNWIFPEMFLEPVKNTYSTDNLQSGQMRVAFTSGGPCHTEDLLQGVLLDSREPYRTKNLCVNRNTSGRKWSDTFHTYTLLWTPDKISTFVDDKYNCEILPFDGFHSLTIDDNMKFPGANKWQQWGTTKLAPFDQEFFLTLGVGVGGHNDFQESRHCKLPWSNTSPRAMSQFWQKRNDWTPSWENGDPTLRVDYVRIYAI
ncbi:Gram-negative bacteria-binding protein 3 [Sergentomyia squamirostris]